MKNLQSFLLIIFFFIFFNCSNDEYNDLFTQEEIDWIKKNKSILLALDDSNVPLNFINTDGELDGYNIELLRLIEEKTKLKINLTGFVWAEALNKAMEHQVDGIINADSTEQRSQKLLFTKGLFSNHKCLLCLDSYNISRSLESFADKKIAVSKNTVHQEILQKFMPDSNIIPVTGVEEALDLLEQKKIDCVYNDYSHLMYWKQKRKLKDTYIAYMGVVKTEARIAIRNDKPIIVSILNKAIDNISQEEKINLLTKWIGKDIHFQEN